MGFSLFTYLLLAISGSWLNYTRRIGKRRPQWLRPLHYLIGGVLVVLVILLLGIGVVGTLGHYGSLGHSAHLGVGLVVVSLVLVSAWSATQIHPQRSWARPLHIGVNIALSFGFILVSLTGWSVVQKYLP